MSAFPAFYQLAILADLALRVINSLSGGELQRVALCIALGLPAVSVGSRAGDMGRILTTITHGQDTYLIDEPSA